MNELHERGVMLLRGVFGEDSLHGLRSAAVACFDAIESGRAPESGWRYNSYSHSVVLAALADFGCEDLLGPLEAHGMTDLIGGATCDPQQSWVRKKLAPVRAPANHRPHSWHQDGGLGVCFPEDPSEIVPMTPLTTLWVPLNPCNGDCPSLEFVRRRADRLIHYSELADEKLRVQFSPIDFWIPTLQSGDGLIFLNGTLHRTHVGPEMSNDRVSIEYRFERL
jgi:hypothetical protein